MYVYTDCDSAYQWNQLHAEIGANATTRKIIGQSLWWHKRLDKCKYKNGEINDT